MTDSDTRASEPTCSGSSDPQGLSRALGGFQPSWGIFAVMAIRHDNSKTAVRAFRRDALLAAYLTALDRIDGPNHPRRAAEFRLEHRPRRARPMCRALQFRAAAASPSKL